MLSLSNVIRFDGLAGLIAGTFVLLFHAWLGEIYRLPHWIIVVNGIANLVYGSFSSTLARLDNRPLILILVLGCANLFWSVVCLVVAALIFRHATWLGVGHAVFEAIFVGTLGVLELRYRHLLAGIRQTASIHNGI